MFDLFRVLLKNSGFILFVIFECIAFYLIINYNRPQREIFLYSSSLFSASVLNQYNRVNDYFNLDGVNERLTEENARLYHQINNRSVIKNSSDSALIDTTLYSFIPCRVISNSINQRNNYFLIDKGRANGIETGMGVIYDNMPVGIVHRTTKNYANVLSFLNSDFNISSKIQRENYFGTVRWTLPDPKKGELLFIPKHANILVGDTITTSGYSSIFPPKLPIGIIEEKSIPPGSNFYDIKIEVIPDISRLDYVYIIKSHSKVELDTLRSLQ